MMHNIKHTIRNTCRRLGFDVHRIRRTNLNSEPCVESHAFDRVFQRLELFKILGFYPQVICDVGASNGCWSRNSLKLFPDARYFCVEPLEEHVPALEHLHQECPNVTYWHGCLGARTETTILYADGDGSSLLPGHWGNSYGTQQEVSIESLDRLIEQGTCPQPDLIKLDVQGYELEVLKGAAAALQNVSMIIAEASFFSFQEGMPLFHDVVGHLAEYGFVVADILSLSVRPLDAAAAQTDILFLQEIHPVRHDNRWAHDSVY